MTRNLLLSTTALIAILGSAGSAFADPSGFVSFGVGGQRFVFDYGMGVSDPSGYAIEGAASGVYAFTPLLNIQGDLVLGLYNIEDDMGALDWGKIDGALHVFHREPDKFLVGGIVQVGRTSLTYEGNDTYELDRAYLGGEAQVYLDSFTLYGQAGWQKYTYSDVDLSMNGFFANLEARYFLTPDLRIEAHAGLSDLSIEIGPGFTTTTWNFGVGAEYKLADSPISLFAEYDFFHSSDNLDDGSTEEHRVLFGARFAIGDDTLLERDRSGPSLEPIKSTHYSLAAE